MEEIDLKELFEFFKGKLGTLAIVTISVCLIGCVYGLFIQKPMYKSYTTVILGGNESSNTGITQSDTSNVVEINLYLALLNYGKNAEFTTVWNQGHTEAERTGSAEDNFISWIAKIEGVSDSTTTSNMNFIRTNFFKILFLFMISIF